MAFQRFNKQEPTPKRPRCPSCYAFVTYIQMGPTQEGKPGGKMMCDPGWIYGDGAKNLVVMIDHGNGILRGKLIAKAPPGVRGYQPHYGTCSKPKGLRTKQDKKQPTRAGEPTARILPLFRN